MEEWLLALAMFTCDPSARPQPNAGLVEEPGEGRCPAGMVQVESYCVDRFEGSLVELREDGTEAPWSPYHNPGEAKVRAVSLRGGVPQGYISAVQAAAACERAGKWLCTDEEWVRACRGPANLQYPYGNTRKPKACNDSRSRHPALELFPGDPHAFDKLGNACLNQLPDGLARGGQYDECGSAEGVHDLMGNLHEWTADPAGTFRGGYYVDTRINGEGCAYVTRAHHARYWDYSTGFRCCSGIR